MGWVTATAYELLPVTAGPILRLFLGVLVSAMVQHGWCGQLLD